MNGQADANGENPADTPETEAMEDVSTSEREAELRNFIS